MTDKENNRTINTPYDDVFRTLLNDCPELIIPVVNEIFKKNYDRREKVLLSNNEIFLKRQNSHLEERITDTQFWLRNSNYHIECQSTPDGTMMIRVFEYDSQIALQNSEWEQNHLTVHFPNTAILYLRHTKNTPDHILVTIDIGQQGRLTYIVPAIKIQNYSIEEIFNKKLYFLIPFHIFSYEKSFSKYENDSKQLKKLTNLYYDIIKTLAECQKQGELSEYELVSIIGLSKKIIEQLANKYSKIRREVGGIMGGNIIDHPAKDILNRGREEGKAIGKEIGKEIGKVLGKAESVIEFLEEKGVVSEDTKEKILSENNLETLSKWLRLALKVESIEEFEMKM